MTLLKSLLKLKFADHMWKVKREETFQEIHEMEQTLKEQFSLHFAEQSLRV